MGGYFSNATEGDAWQNAWCASCTSDHAYHPGGAGDPIGCPIFLVALSDLEPPEWTRREGAPFILPPDVVCSAYEPCTLDDCSGDPQPAARAAARARVAEAAVLIIHHESTGE